MMGGDRDTVPDSFAYLWEPFPPTEVPCSTSIRWHVSDLTVACCAMFD